MLLGDGFISSTALISCVLRASVVAALISLEATRPWQRKAILLQNCVCSLQKVLCRLRNKAEREVSHRDWHIAAACKCQDTIIPLGWVPEETFLRKNILPLQFPFTLILEPLMGLTLRAVRKVVCSRTDIHLFPGIPSVQVLTKAHADPENVVTSTCCRFPQSLDITNYICVYPKHTQEGLLAMEAWSKGIDNRRFPIDFQRL